MFNIKFISSLVFLWASSFLNCENLITIKNKNFKIVEHWPEYNNFGQISGIDVDNSENVYVFHRGNRQWEYSSFTSTNIFTAREDGPILDDTIVVLSFLNGSLIFKTGRKIFYLPHGITIDNENNIWVTDVALHQVFKFPPLKFNSSKTLLLEKPLLTLGVAFEPGDDDQHFCKPTDVVVDKQTKDFFVSDGYCNSRIIKFNQYGKKLLTWGRTSVGSMNNNFFMLNIPHAIAMAHGKNSALYVADRENFRVISYSAELGNFRNVFPQNYNSRTYGVAHFSNNEIDIIFVLINDGGMNKAINVYNTETGELIHFFSQNNFSNPHDLALSKNGKFCYVVELYPYKVWKFEIELNGKKTIQDTEKIQELIGVVNEKPYPSVLHPNKLDFDDEFMIGSNYLASSLVAFIVIISVFFFLFHCKKRKGFSKTEISRQILDHDEDESVNKGSICLT